MPIITPGDATPMDVASGKVFNAGTYYKAIGLKEGGGYTERTLTSSGSPANYYSHTGTGGITSSYLSLDTASLPFTPKFMIATYSGHATYSGMTIWASENFFVNSSTGAYANCLTLYDPAAGAAENLIRLPYAVVSNFLFPVGRALQSYVLKIYG